MKPTLTLISALLLAALLALQEASAAESSAELATRLLKAVGRPVGLVHLPRCGDGSLALALAAGDTNLRLHGQDSDNARVLQARQAADAQALLGRRVWVDQGGISRLLLAGHSADLVVLTDLKSSDLTPQLASEIRRVLHPWHGLAILGNTAEPLDAAVLGQWAGTIAREAQPLPGEGTLVKVKADPLPAADDWPMWWHGPDNNAVSTDTAFKLPSTIQWTGKPFFGPTRLELPIVAGGRLFMLWNGHELDSSRGPLALAGQKGDDPLLMAKAVGSGARLWLRRLSPAAWLQVSRSIVVADGERLLVADGNRVLELDAATGQETKQTQLDCPEIKWMALHQGRLLVLGGALTQNYGHRSEKAVIPFRSSGLNLIALDRASFQPLWRLNRTAGQEAFDPRSAAVDGDRLFLCTEKDTAECYSVKDGKLVWKVSVGFQRMQIQAFEWDRSSRHPVTGYAQLGVYVISATEMEEAVVLSQTDGKRLWTTPTPRHTQFIPLAFRGLLWEGDSGLDPLTGVEKMKITPSRSGGCARNTMAPQGLIEACGISYDFTANAAGRLLEPLKTSCSAGSFIANGLLWKFPVPCTACTEWRGFIVQAGRENPPQSGERLHRSDAAAVAGADAQGWLTYRGNARRSSAIDFTIPAAATIRWNAKPAHPVGAVSHHTRTLMEAEVVPAPPVVAGSRIIIAYGDGAVDALDLSSGKRLWRAYTSGRIQSSPTAWRDRVFVGSADGNLYAFALADGRELWRLRAAPDSSRIMVYEQLASRWPILCSPLVADNRVVVSAGLMDMVDGVRAVCADAASGQILWEQGEWTASESGGKISGGGQFCLGDELFYHGGMAPPIRIRPTDGFCRPAFPATAEATLAPFDNTRWKTAKAFGQVWSRVKGQDVGLVAPEWLAYGGRRLWTDQAEEGTWRTTIKFLARDRNGGGRLPVVDVLDSELLPAWDEQDVVFTCTPTKKSKMTAVVAVPRDRLQKALNQLMTGPGTAEILALAKQPPKNAITAPPELLSREFTVQTDGLFRWSSPFAKNDLLIACVLTRNAVLVVSTRPHHEDPARDLPGQLTALNRADGKKLWEVNLPARVVHNGLAVASDGSIVLTLMDGQVVCIGIGAR